MNRRRRCRGFTLAEVLVTLFVIGNGLLGCAWLLTGRLGAAQHLAAQETATRLLADLHERLAAGLLDAAAISAWQAAAATQLPALPGSPARADLQLELTAGALARGRAQVRWGIRGGTTAAASALPEVLPAWPGP